jgi:hypothetical protein
LRPGEDREENGPSNKTKPANPTNNTSASPSFSSNESNFTLECKPDDSDYVDCSSARRQYTELAHGSHIFSV